MKTLYRSVFLPIFFFFSLGIVSSQDTDSVRIGALTKNTDNPFFVRMEAGYEFAAERYDIEILVGSVPDLVGESN